MTVSRIEHILARLEQFYGLLSAPPSDPFMSFVWEVLAAQTTAQRTAAAFSAMKRARAVTPDAVLRAPEKTLQDAVRRAGPYVEQRIAALRTGAGVFRRSPDISHVIQRSLASARAALEALPQADEGSIERMLLFAGGHAVMPVDARVNRTARRLGYGSGHAFAESAASVRQAIVGELSPAPEALRRAYLYLSHHAASTCTENEPHCSVCPVLSECAYGAGRVQPGNSR